MAPESFSIDTYSFLLCCLIYSFTPKMNVFNSVKDSTMFFVQKCFLNQVNLKEQRMKISDGLNYTEV